MKFKFVFLVIFKYLIFLFLTLFFLTSYKFNLFVLFLFVLIFIALIYYDFYILKKLHITKVKDAITQEIKELNLEAAVQSETVEVLENNEIKDKRLKEFVDKVTLIKKELNLKNHELDALQEVTQIITSIVDVKTIIEYLYTVFNRFTGCDRYLISFYNKDKDILTYKYEFGSIMFNEIGSVVEKDSMVLKCFETKTAIKRTDVYIKRREVFGDKIAIPLHSSGQILGVLFIETAVSDGFKNVSLEFLENLSVYITIALKNAELFDNIYEQKQEIEALYEETAAVNDELNSYIDELNNTKEELKEKNNELTKFFNEMQTGYFQTVMALANSIEAKDPYTRGHCQRVMELSCEIAKNLGMEEEQIEDLKYAAILHDIGKIGVPAKILNKTGKLTEEEFNEIKRHPLIAYNILKDVEFIKNGLNGILQHHERNDGKGYPYGLQNQEICLFAKILCVADAFDAMTSDRPYRKGMSMEEAINEIERCKGAQFDEDIATMFVDMSKQIIYSTKNTAF